MTQLGTHSPVVTVSRIAEGREPSILLVDFARFSAADTLSRRLATGVTGHAVSLIDTVGDLSAQPRFHTLDDLAAAYTDVLLASGSRPGLVVGYCSASTLALRVADELADAGAAPAVVLVEPTWPTSASVATDLQNMRANVLGRQVPFEELPAAPPADQLAYAAQTLRADFAVMAAEQGLSDDEAELFIEEITGRYNAWIAFVLATAATEALPEPGDVILSADAPAGHPPAWTEARHRVVRLPASSAQLFADDAVCREITTIAAGLGGRR